MTRPLIVAIVVMVAAAAPAAADDPAATAYFAAYTKVLDEDWAGAAASLEQYQRDYPRSEWSDDAAFWSCYVSGRSGGDAASTFACYERLLERYPESEWADDARRRMVTLAQRLARAGRTEFRARVESFDSTEVDADLAVLLALAEIGDERSLEIVLERLHSADDPRVRERLVEIIEDVDGQRVDQVLISLAEGDPSSNVRAAALDALGDRSGPAATEVLRRIAADPEQPEASRTEAFDALGDRGDPELVRLALEVATSGPGEVAEEAVDALGDLGTREALAALEKIISEGITPGVRAQALDELADNGGAAVHDLLATVARSSDLELAVEAIEELADLETERSVEILSELGRQVQSQQLRSAALEGLAESEHPNAIEAIGELLQQSPDPMLRRQAVEALGWSENPHAIRLLARLAASNEDPMIRAEAVQALGEIGTAEAREALIMLLEKGDSE